MDFALHFVLSNYYFVEFNFVLTTRATLTNKTNLVINASKHDDSDLRKLLFQYNDGQNELYILRTLERKGNIVKNPKLVSTLRTQGPSS